MRSQRPALGYFAGWPVGVEFALWIDRQLDRVLAALRRRARGGAAR